MAVEIVDEISHSTQLKSKPDVTRRKNVSFIAKTRRTVHVGCFILGVKPKIKRTKTKVGGSRDHALRKNPTVNILYMSNHCVWNGVGRIVRTQQKSVTICN